MRKLVVLKAIWWHNIKMNHGEKSMMIGNGFKWYMACCKGGFLIPEMNQRVPQELEIS
jgi:hypothetical protein